MTVPIRPAMASSVICRTANRTLVRVRQATGPARAKRVDRTVRLRGPAARRCSWSRWPVTPALRRRRRPGGGERRRSKSASRSSTSSRPTETRTRPWAMPASASAASSSWRCVVDGGWTAIVWTLPSDAVRGGMAQAVEEGRRGRALTKVEREHAAAGAQLRAARRRPADGWAGRGTRHGGPRAAPRGSAPAPAPLAQWRSMRTCSVSMPRSTRKALNGATMPPVSISTRADRVDQLARCRPRPRPARPSARRSTWCTTRRRGRRRAPAGRHR